MGEIRYGSITMVLSEELPLSERAGRMSPKEVSRLSKAPLGLRPLCEDTADAVEKAGPLFLVPPGVTPASLREIGARAEKIDQAICDAEVLLHRLKQQSLLYKAEAYDQARAVNDQVKVQSKRMPALRKIFERMLAFFYRLRPKAKSTTPPTTTPATASAPAPAVALVPASSDK